MSSIHILNGPNLNRLGTREPHIYGHDTLASIEARCRERAQALGFGLAFMQSNLEGELIDAVHRAIDDRAAGLVINPAGYSFTSVALVDALKMFSGTKIEVHLSNIHAREAMYHHSCVSAVVTAVVAGLGADGYGVAIDAVARRAAAGGG